MWVSVYTAAHKLPGGAWLVAVPWFQTLHRAGRERKRFPESPVLQEVVYFPPQMRWWGKKSPLWNRYGFEVIWKRARLAGTELHQDHDLCVRRKRKSQYTRKG